jgi:hypothetical protein
VKQRIVLAAVVILLVAVGLALRSRDRAAATPEAAINAWFDAAARGDDRACLALVSGTLRASLEETRSQLGAEAFRKGLQVSMTGIKGFAVTAAGGATANVAAFDVDLVFSDRNERQRMLLTPQGGGWVIASISKADARKPAIPYGTPVFEKGTSPLLSAPPPSSR